MTRDRANFFSHVDFTSAIVCFSHRVHNAGLVDRSRSKCTTILILVLHPGRLLLPILQEMLQAL